MQNLTAKAATSLLKVTPSTVSTPSKYSKLTVCKAGHSAGDVTQATLVAQITYASPSWRGLIKAEETARLKTTVKSMPLWIPSY